MTTYATIKRKGIEFVMVPRADFERLAAPGLPTLPRADREGNRPAVEFARVATARNIIRGRKAAGLSQAELARRAGVRVETLNRIEKARVTADTATLAKIDRALRAKVTARSRPQITTANPDKSPRRRRVRREDKASTEVGLNLPFSPRPLRLRGES